MLTYAVAILMWFGAAWAMQLADKEEGQGRPVPFLYYLLWPGLVIAEGLDKIFRAIYAGYRLMRRVI